MLLSIRQLTSDDVALMEALLTTFGEAFDDVDTYGAKRPDAMYLRQLLGSDHFIALAAIKGSEVVGGLAAYELKKIAAARAAYVIFVQADLGDEPAIALYTKLGVREDVLHFDVAVPPQASAADTRRKRPG